MLATRYGDVSILSQPELQQLLCAQRHKRIKTNVAPGLKEQSQNVSPLM